MIPILLDDSKALTSLVSGKTNGLGRLPECTSCIVTEERNGAYTAELKYPVSGKHFRDIHIGGLIKMSVNETDTPQIFRIADESKEMNGMVTYNLNHISYDLSKTSVLPFSATGCTAACNGLISNMATATPFTMTTDIANTSSVFKNAKPQSMRALIGGQDGSILDTFGGELKWDNLTVSLLANRGADKSKLIRIAYGKNLTSVKQEKSIENTYTAVLPYASDDNGNVATGDIQTITTATYPKVLNVDLSDKFKDAEGNATAITKTLLAQYAQDYIKANDVGKPTVNIDVSYASMNDLGLPQLENVSLCDTLTVQYKQLGIDVSAKAISVKWNTLLDRVEEVEIGDAKSHLEDTIYSETDKKTDQASSYISQQVALFSELISNGLGLFTTKVQKTGGGIQFYLHNKPLLKDSNIQYTINSAGFAISKDYGATWSAGIDSDGNAVFNALAANTIKALTISAGTISGTTITGGTITGTTVNGSTIIFGTDDSSKITAEYSSQGSTVGGIMFSGQGAYNVKTSGISLEALCKYHNDGSIDILNRDASDNVISQLSLTSGGISFTSNKNIIFSSKVQTCNGVNYGTPVVSTNTSGGDGMHAIAIGWTGAHLNFFVDNNYVGQL
jgi:phage minor structural protein